MAIANPNTTPTLLPSNDIVNYASTTPSAHTWYAKYTNNTGSTQTVYFSCPMGPLETTRSWTSTDTGVTGNGASGSTAIYDTLTVTAGGTVTYTIASTYTLASGRTFGTNTNKATFAVSGGSTYKRFQVVTVGYGNAATQQRFANQIRASRDVTALMDRLLVNETDLMEAQELYDWLENAGNDTVGSDSFLTLRKVAYGLGGLKTTSQSGDYSVRPEDYFVLETGNSKTVTMPLPELYPGRVVVLRDTGSTGVVAFGGGSVDGGSTGATAALTQNKTFGYISDGTTWRTLYVQG